MRYGWLSLVVVTGCIMGSNGVTLLVPYDSGAEGLTAETEAGAGRVDGATDRVSHDAAGPVAASDAAASDAAASDGSGPSDAPTTPPCTPVHFCACTLPSTYGTCQPSAPHPCTTADSFCIGQGAGPDWMAWPPAGAPDAGA
jgi:hypothetical protein